MHHLRQERHHRVPRLLAVATSVAVNRTVTVLATPFASLTSSLTGSVLVSLALTVQPIKAQDDKEEDECSTSYCEVIEADFEHVLVSFRLHVLGLLDGAGLLLPDPIVFVDHRTKFVIDIHHQWDDIIPTQVHE